MPRRISFYLSCLTILLLPAYVVRFPILGLPSTLLEVLILTTLVIWVIETIRGGIKIGEIWSKVNYPFFWIGIVLVTVALAQVFVSSDWRSGAGLWRAYFLEPFLFSLVLIDLGRKDVGKYFLWSLVGSGLWVTLIALAQIHLRLFIDITSESALEVSYGRAVAVFNSGNALALFLGPLTILSVGLILKRRLVFLIPIVLFVIVIIESKSRGGLIALLSGALVTSIGYLSWLIRPSFMPKFWAGCAVFFLAVSASFAIFFANIAYFAPDTRPETGRIYNDTGVLRLCLWEGTNKILQDSPVVGTGLSGFSSSYQKSYTCDSEALKYPHNLYLNFWTETGLAGLAVMIVIVTLVFILLAGSKEQLLALGLGGAWLYLIVHGLADVPYFKNDLAMQWWVLLVLSTLVKENKLQSG